VNVDELERQFIRAAQHELGPSAADRERNQVALLDRLAAEPWGGASGGALGAGKGTRSIGAGALAGIVGSMRGSRLGILGVGLIVGAVVGGVFGFGLGRSGWNAPPAPVTDAVAAPRAAPSGESTAEPASMPLEAGSGEPDAVVPHLAPAAVEPSPSLEVPTSSGSADADAARRRSVANAKPHGPRRAVTPAQPESSLAIELAMLQRARRALNADNGRLALGIVQELDERFPNGVLVEERSATRILSLCQLERVAEAKQSARAFLERYPTSVYAERVRQSCAAAAPRPSHGRAVRRSARRASGQLEGARHRELARARRLDCRLRGQRLGGRGRAAAGCSE